MNIHIHVHQNKDDAHVKIEQPEEKQTVSLQISRCEHETMRWLALSEGRSTSSVYRDSVKNFLRDRSRVGGTIVEYAMVTATVAWIGIIMLKLFVMWVYSIF